MKGQSITDGKVLFMIYSTDGDELWNEEFNAIDLIGYGLDLDAPVAEKEKYIKNAFQTFLTGTII